MKSGGHEFGSVLFFALARLLSFSERRILVLEPWFDFILRCADRLAIFKRLVVTASAGDALIVPNIFGWSFWGSRLSF